MPLNNMLNNFKRNVGNTCLLLGHSKLLRNIVESFSLPYFLTTLVFKMSGTKLCSYLFYRAFNHNSPVFNAVTRRHFKKTAVNGDLPF